MINLFERYVVDIANGNGSQHIVQVISSNKMGLNGKPFASIVRLAVLLAPTELQEGST